MIAGPADASAAHTLEGLVETDWAVATSTMDWKLTVRHRWVHFSVGDRICFVLPVEPALIGAAEPAIAALSEVTIAP
jgi:Family of unknown function (DUF6065)